MDPDLSPCAPLLVLCYPVESISAGTDRAGAARTAAVRSAACPTACCTAPRTAGGGVSRWVTVG